MIGIDYFYLTGKGLQSVEGMGCSRHKSGLDTLDELVGQGVAAKCLIATDQNSKCIFGHMVPKNGLDAKGYAVECVKSDMLWLGHSRVILKSDNELALLALGRLYSRGLPVALTCSGVV